MGVTVIQSGRFGSTFVPTDISGCALWLDASDSSGVIVSQWNDKSGNASHMTQGTVGNQPARDSTINSLSAVNFPSGKKMATSDPGSTTSQPVTVFAIATTTISVGSQNLLSTGYATTTGATVGASGSASLIYAGSNATAGTLATSTAYALQWTVNGASSEIRVDGGADLTAANPGSGGYRGYALGSYQSSGSGDWWAGLIAEVLVYTGALSLANINAVGSYLGTRWGVTWTTAT